MFYLAAISVAVMCLISLPCLKAREARQGDLPYYDWEETVKPEQYEAYVAF